MKKIEIENQVNLYFQIENHNMRSVKFWDSHDSRFLCYKTIAITIPIS